MVVHSSKYQQSRGAIYELLRFKVINKEILKTFIFFRFSQWDLWFSSIVRSRLNLGFLNYP